MPITKDQKQMAIVGVLLVVMVLVFMNNFKPKKKKNAPIPAPAVPAVAVNPPAGQPAGQAKADSGKSETGQKERVDALGWGRDPFVPYEEQTAAETELILNGVSIVKGKKGYALINGLNIVTVGETFMEKYKVVEIEKDKVLLKKGEQSFYISFPKGDTEE